jgi:DNA primase
MRIPNETIERIKQSADIVEVVSDFISLKKRGANYQACCPFHNEKTPSFSVNPVRQIFKCFGCGAAGDPIKFVMDIEGIGYNEALRYLAQKYQIEVAEEVQSPEEVNRQNERESILIVLNFAQQFFQNNLFENEEGQGIGLSYFRNRGFNDPSIKTFGLGYSLNEWDAFIKEATKRGYNPDILAKAGLTNHKEGENRFYDRFRGRVMFPIHNVAGKVIAFGARILSADKTQPKYINSPETEVYHKSKILYGIAQAKNAIRNEDSCYLVEGYTDAISLHQAGIQNVVASSGTSLTEDQIKLMSRFTQNVTILYDGDAAGIKAALRGLDMVLEEGLNVSLVTLPDGEDPDSYVFKVGAEGFKKHVKQHTKDFISFKTEMLLHEAGNDPFKRASAIVEVVESITKIPDAIKRQVFFKRTADLMNVDEQTLISESNKIVRKQQNQKQTRQAEQPPRPDEGISDFDIGLLENIVGPDISSPTQEPTRSKAFYQEQRCVQLLIGYATNEIEVGITLCHYVLSQLGDIEFETPIFNHILSSFRERFLHNEILPTEYFINHIDPEIQQLSISLLVEKYQLNDWEQQGVIVPTEVERLHDAAYNNVLRIKKCITEQRMAEIQGLLPKVGNNIEEEMELLRQFMFFKQKDNEIAKMLGTVISG